MISLEKSCPGHQVITGHKSLRISLLKGLLEMNADSNKKKSHNIFKLRIHVWVLAYTSEDHIWVGPVSPWSGIKDDLAVWIKHQHQGSPQFMWHTWWLFCEPGTLLPSGLLRWIRSGPCLQGTQHAFTNCLFSEWLLCTKHHAGGRNTDISKAWSQPMGCSV